MKSTSKRPALEEANQILAAFMIHDPTNIVVWDRNLGQYIVVPNPNIVPSKTLASYPTIKHAQGFLMDFHSYFSLGELKKAIESRIGINYQEIRQRYVIAGTQKIYYIEAFEATPLQMSPEFIAAVNEGRAEKVYPDFFGVR